jgi:ParB-like chromosome segregation protein Spo0J|tara:strand:- start:938 stop:1453 length:516 start_codon:yes stop_codon:yes gene_type:complete
MKIKDIELSKLKPAEYNPRQITKKQVKDLKESIEKFGIVDPLIINSDNTIIGGHQRFAILNEASKKVDWEYPPKVPCVILDLSKEQERELNIRLNKSGGDWDFDLLSNFEIEELKDWGFKEIELGLNIDKIEEKKDDSYIVSVKTKDALEAEKIHLELKEQGYNVTLKKSV